MNFVYHSNRCKVSTPLTQSLLHHLTSNYHLGHEFETISLRSLYAKTLHGIKVINLNGGTLK